MSKEETHYDVIVIGGGPAGMMAAGTAGARGKEVLLIEKNKKLGEKLRITGGGRCNIANNEPDIRKLLARYGKAEQFLYSSFAQFGVKETFDFFESRGLPLITEAGNRVFPKTERAIDVEQCMEKYCKDGNVTILTDAPVKRIIADGGLITGVVAKSMTYTADSFIIATGGMSHPETGSTGDGFAWLRNLGHVVADATPSIVPIAVKDAWIKSLAGVTLSNMKIQFFADGKKQFSKSGNVLFTHFGLSGPLILNSAKDIGDLLHSGTVTGTIDVYPKKDFSVLDQEIIALFDAHKNKTFKNFAKAFMPPGMSGAILSLFDESLQEKKVHSVSKEERKLIVHILKALPFTVKGLMGYDRAVVADGGIPVAEIDTRTFASKKYPNLYLTGDLLHVNRPTGGFSLQLCWTTGYVAGNNA